MVALFLSACNKNDKGSSAYQVPDTYNFPDADSLPAKTLLSMIAQLEIAINRGNTGARLNADALKKMYANEGAPFADTVFNGVSLSLNNSGLSLQSATAPQARQSILDWMDSVDLASQSTQPASDGVAGVSSRQSLLSQSGVYWRQLFTKTMMGVVIAHQITDVYLTDSLASDISMQARRHAWDQAFFLWCVPANFPANRKGVKYWGSYTSQIDSGVARPVTALTGINANVTLMSAFLKGRAALSNNDLATALQQASVIISLFEKMEAAAALHELNEAKGNLVNSSAAVAGNISESLGFWMALRFNTQRKLSDADLQSVFDLYGNNFWKATEASIEATRDRISTLYGWDAIKSNL